MQDKELYDSFSVLDRVTPPAGVKERLLRERILKQKETPVNDSHSELSVFSIIEDKRLDIQAPMQGEGPAQKETSDTPAPLQEGEKQGAALFKQPRAFIYLAALAACVAVIALGAFAVSFFKGRSGLETTPADSAADMRERIFSGKESIYKLLANDNRGGDDYEGADGVYQLANGGYLLIKGNGYISLADIDMNITAQSLVRANDHAYKFITSSQELIFLGYYYQNPNTQGENVLEFQALDINTLEVVSTITLMTTDYAVNGRVVSFDVTPYDYILHEDGADDPKKLASYFFVLDYYDDKGMEKSTVFRIGDGDERAQEVFSVTNEKGGDTLERIEGVYADYNLSDDFGSSLFAVTCKMQRVPQDNTLGSFTKTYYAYLLDAEGEEKPVKGELFTETDAYSAATFDKQHTAFVVPGGAEPGNLYILNNSTGLLTIVYGGVYAYDRNKGTATGGSENVLDFVNVTDAMPSASYYLQGGASRYSMAVQNKCGYDQILYVGDDGYQSMIKSELEGRKIVEEQHDTQEIGEVIISRIDYDASGEPIKTIFFNAFQGSCNFGNFSSVDGKAISVANGQAVIQYMVYENTATTPDWLEEDILHTPGGVYKLDWHM